MTFCNCIVGGEAMPMILYMLGRFFFKKDQAVYRHHVFSIRIKRLGVRTVSVPLLCNAPLAGVAKLLIRPECWVRIDGRVNQSHFIHQTFQVPKKWRYSPKISKPPPKLPCKTQYLYFRYLKRLVIYTRSSIKKVLGLRSREASQMPFI